MAFIVHVSHGKEAELCTWLQSVTLQRRMFSLKADLEASPQCFHTLCC